MIEIQPPTISNAHLSHPGITVFLAGSIEMGAAVDWQSLVVDLLSDQTGTVLNPRRDNWDSSWEQSIDNLQFRGQVEWELRGALRADIVLYYFHPDTKAPVTLLELGLGAHSKGSVVYCPEGYWRKGNVDIVCAEHHIPQVKSFEEFVLFVRHRNV